MKFVRFNLAMVAETARQDLLMKALEEENVLLVRRLSKKVSIENYDKSEGLTSLHIAAKQGSLKMVKCLVDLGHEKRCISRDRAGNTPLLLAASANHESVVNYLARKFPKCLNMTNSKLQTPLMMAAQKGNDTVCNMLLDFGVNVNAFDIKGDTALHYSTAWGHLMVIRLLLLRGAEFDKENHAGFDAASYCHSYTCNTYFVSTVADLERAKRRPTVSSNRSFPLAV